MYTLLLYTFIVFLLFNYNKISKKSFKICSRTQHNENQNFPGHKLHKKKTNNHLWNVFFRNYTQFTAEPIDYQWNKTDQQSFMSNLIPSGQDTGTGRLSELLPTPQMTAEVSTSLYGTSCVISSHSSTPYDLQLHHQLHHLPQFCVLEKKMTPVNY